MSIQDNYLKTTDGYFARLTPLLDSVEEVTVTTAGNTADATGQGGVQIRFVTKSGTNSWTGTAYEYLPARRAEREHLVPQPRPAARSGDRQGAEGPSCDSYQQGVAQGGPIMKNKAFFFFNYEEQRAPSVEHAAARHPHARRRGRHLQLQRRRRRRGRSTCCSSRRRTASSRRSIRRSRRCSRDIQAATQTERQRHAAVSNPLVQQYTWSMPTQSFNPSPTFRLDYEVTQKHRLTGSMNYRHINSTPDTTNNAQLPFPDSPTTGSQQSTRWTTSESLRSTFGDQPRQRVPRRRHRRRDAVLAGARDRRCAVRGIGNQGGYRLELQRRLLRHRLRC